MDAANIRPPVIAGSWYPSQPEQLRAQVDAFLRAAAPPVLSGPVVGLVVPHAGLRYSGATAGYGFRCVQGCAPQVVAVLSPFHQYPDEGIFVTHYDHYLTPLGSVSLDRPALDGLGERVALTAISREQEHAIEIELPFLQHTLEPTFGLLPLMLAVSAPADVYQLGEALAETLRGRDALLIASSDLSHFRPLHIAKALDAEMLRQMAAFSPEGLLAAQRAGQGYACGLMAILAVMVAARALGAEQAQVLHYSTSADVSGDQGSVVGYGAVAFTRAAVD